MLMFLKAVGEAVVAKALKVASEFVPFGDKLYEVGADVIDRYRKAKREDKLAADALAAVHAGMDKIREDAKLIAREVAAGESQEIIELVEAYLTQVPAAVTQSLKRADDPTGTTLPFGYAVSSAEDVAKMLPPRVPRFRPNMPLPGRDGWVLERLLGVGGFGEVWFARNTEMPDEPEHAGAVKFCFGQTGRDLIHESDLILRVRQAGRHPHIVPLKDRLLKGDSPWLMFEYVAGGTLTDWIHALAGKPNEQRLPPVLAAIRQLAEAVAFFHRLPKPVVHRDLKPSNILHDRATDALRITDFGIGAVTAAETNRQESRGQTSRGGRLLSYLYGSHTPIYSSPQQRAGADPDPRDDIHALGVIAYQMLTGKLDKAPGTGAAGAMKRMGVSADVAELLLRCASEELDDRPTDAGELAAELAKVTSGVLVSGGHKPPVADGERQDVSPPVPPAPAQASGSAGPRTPADVSSETLVQLIRCRLGLPFAGDVAALRRAWDSLTDHQRGDLAGSVGSELSNLLRQALAAQLERKPLPEHLHWTNGLAPLFTDWLDQQTVAAPKVAQQLGIVAKRFRKTLADPTASDVSSETLVQLIRWRLGLPFQADEQALRRAWDGLSEIQRWDLANSAATQLSQLLRQTLATQVERESLPEHLQWANGLAPLFTDWLDQQTVAAPKVAQQLGIVAKRFRKTLADPTASAMPSSYPGKVRVDPAVSPPASSRPPTPPPVRKTGDRHEITLPGGVKMHFAWCPPGTFLMGSPPSEKERASDEQQHKVTFTRGFWMGIHPVTQAQWKAAMGTNPSRFQGDTLPVEQVSWDNTQAFCATLKQMGGVELRLPTEAEWEYAARGGTATAFYWGDQLNGTQANCDGNHPYCTMTKGPHLQKTSPVGSYAKAYPHPWGLCDVHGNVAEWCADRYDEWFYGKPEATKDPVCSTSGLTPRVLRGACWGSYARNCRAARRLCSKQWERSGDFGFRLCLDEPQG